LAPKRIVVLGGPSVVSNGVLGGLDAYTDGPVTRLSGTDRYATAAAVTAAVFPRGVFAVFLATGGNFPDALSGGPAAAYDDSPLLLVTKTTVPTSTAQELNRLRPAVIFILGGTSVVSDTVKAAVKQYTSTNLASRVVRLSGADRYATATAITFNFFNPGLDAVYVATGANFPDALAGGPAAALEDGALLLVTQSAIPNTTKTELTRLKPKRIVVLGGPSVVSDTVKNQLAAYVVP
jgi:putative cell wall-binding protein